LSTTVIESEELPGKSDRSVVQLPVAISKRITRGGTISHKKPSTSAGPPQLAMLDGGLAKDVLAAAVISHLLNELPEP
jgi:hypothetical protein